VPRATADRLFLTALREPGLKKGSFRQLADVDRRQPLRQPGPPARTLRRRTGAGRLGTGGGRGFLGLTDLGDSWRAGVDLRGGWLFPQLMLVAALVVPLLLPWPSPFEGWSPFTLLLAATVLVFAGLPWRLVADPTLR
jgi:hypothetical protein